MKRLLVASAALAGQLAIGLAVTSQAAYAQACIQLPVDCRVTSAFGQRFDPITRNFSSEFHHGLDFGCPMGSPVSAADGGIVKVSGFSTSAGNWVVTVTPGTGTVFKYMHNERLKTSVGQMVNKGEQLALSGNTGRSTGPHLHFQMEVGGKASDPMGRFCSRPEMKPGVLDGATVPESDIIDPGSQAKAPTDGGGAPPPMGMEGSIHEVLADVVASRALNPDYARQLSDLSDTRLYAELAYQRALLLKLKHERSRHRERIEATQAMLQILMTDAALRPQLEAQRSAASRLNK